MTAHVTTAGHAFAAGAFIAMSHDHMIMRTGKGWFCLPEINLKFTFIVGFMELIKYVVCTYLD